MHYYKRAAKLGNHFKAYSKCADFYYSQGSKKGAFAWYKKAAELGDTSAFNNMGLMLETGYDDVKPDHKLALQNYKEAFNHGNTDALINIAVYYLNDRYVSRDQKVGQALLKKAY